MGLGFIFWFINFGGGGGSFLHNFKRGAKTGLCGTWRTIGAIMELAKTIRSLFVVVGQRACVHVCMCACVFVCACARRGGGIGGYDVQFY